MKAPPLSVPRSELRIRMNAVTGMGSSVTARPMRIRSRTATGLLPFRASACPPGHGHASVLVPGPVAPATTVGVGVAVAVAVAVVAVAPDAPFRSLPRSAGVAGSHAAAT